MEYSKGLKDLNTLYIYLNHEHVRKKQTDEAGSYFNALHDNEKRLEIGPLGLEIWMNTMIIPQQDKLLPLILNVVREDRRVSFRVCQFVHDHSGARIANNVEIAHFRALRVTAMLNM